MSPRAAWRLESLGFGDVYDYVAGKLDWMAAGLPTDGTNAQHPRAGDVARKDVPTAQLDERLGDVRPGPSTFRPHVSIKEMAQKMTQHQLESSPITTLDGRLVGLLLQKDAVQKAGEKE